MECHVSGDDHPGIVHTIAFQALSRVRTEIKETCKDRDTTYRESTGNKGRKEQKDGRARGRMKVR